MCARKGGTMEREEQKGAYDSAQRAIAKSSNIVTIAKYVLIGLGVISVAGGVVALMRGGLSGAITPLLIGGVCLYIGLRQMSTFESMIGDASQLVDGLAAETQLAASGLPAEALVQSIRQTGRMVNQNPEVHLALTVVHPQTNAEYAAEIITVVDQIAIPQVQPGSRIAVRVDPLNAQRVALALHESARLTA